jgi:hypothetical protein
MSPWALPGRPEDRRARGGPARRRRAATARGARVRPRSDRSPRSRRPSTPGASWRVCRRASSTDGSWPVDGGRARLRARRTVESSKCGGALGAPVERRVTDRRDGARSARPGSAGHRPAPGGQADDEDRASRDGIPVTTVARTLLDLAESVSPHQLGRAFEEAERLRFLDLQALHSGRDRSPGRQGLRALSILLADGREPLEVRSGLERRFVELCREANLPLPALNAVVAGHDVDARACRGRRRRCCCCCAVPARDSDRGDRPGSSEPKCCRLLVGGVRR